jgi:hypothetical protein
MQQRLVNQMQQKIQHVQRKNKQTLTRKEEHMSKSAPDGVCHICSQQRWTKMIRVQPKPEARVLPSYFIR